MISVGMDIKFNDYELEIDTDKLDILLLQVGFEANSFTHVKKDENLYVTFYCDNREVANEYLLILNSLRSDKTGLVLKTLGRTLYGVELFSIGLDSHSPFINFLDIEHANYLITNNKFNELELMVDNDFQRLGEVDGDLEYIMEVVKELVIETERDDLLKGLSKVVH